MGRDAYLETESGEVLQTVGDPRCLIDWLESLAPPELIASLRRIDRYNDTIFSIPQIALLGDELRSISSFLNQNNLEAAKIRYKQRVEHWSRKGRENSEEYIQSITLEEIQNHHSQLSVMVGSALKGDGRYHIRFVGD